MASFKISYFIAKHKKNFIIAEYLILPSGIVIVSELFEENSAALVKSVKLSNDTVKRRIYMIHTDIMERLVERLKRGKFGFFSLQIDESTDINITR